MVLKILNLKHKKAIIRNNYTRAEMQTVKTLNANIFDYLENRNSPDDATSIITGLSQIVTGLGQGQNKVALYLFNSISLGNIAKAKNYVEGKGKYYGRFN